MPEARSAEAVQPRVPVLRPPVPQATPRRDRRRLPLLALVLAVVGAGCGTPAGKSGPAGGGASSGSSSGSPGTTSGSGATAYCRIATLGHAGMWGQGNVFTDWLATQSAQGTTALGDAVLTAELLAPFQLVVVQDVRAGAPGQSGVGQGIGRAYSADEVEALRAWVAGGGGLMTLIGYADASEVTNVNRLLGPHGLSYGATQILHGGGGTTVAVTHWASGHPVSAGVTQVGVDNGYPVEGGGTLVAWEPSADGAVARAVDTGSGHVLAWGDEWITYNSEWTGRPEYQVAHLWANAFEWLSRAYGCQVPIPDGEW